MKLKKKKYPDGGTIKGREDKKESLFSFLIPEAGQGTGRNNPYFEELANYYKGDQTYKYKYLSNSNYIPTKAKNSSSNYLAINDPLFKKRIIEEYNNPKNIRKGNRVDVSYAKDLSALGKFSIYSGKDEKGNYLSYYDLWDVNGLADKIGKPFELYDRIYIDDTSNTSSPNPLPPVPLINKKIGNEYSKGGILNNMRKKNKYPVGQIIGAGLQIGEMIGGPIRQRAEQIDPETGLYEDKNRAIRNAAAGSIWAPHKAITASLSDPNATGAEKALSFTSLLGIPGLTKMWAKKHYNRLEQENWQAANPNEIGQSVNPYYMATGGVAGEYAELEDGEPFMTPDGKIQMVNGKTHAQGGEDFILPTGTAILGKNKSKMYGEKFKELGARLKKAQDKHEKILDERSTPIARRTSLMMMDHIDNEFKGLMMEQEMDKIKTMRKKGMKYPLGGWLNLKDSLSTVSPYTADFSQGMDLSGINEGAPEPMTGRELVKHMDAGDKGFDFNNIAGTVGQLAPIAYNIGQGLFSKPDVYRYKDYVNPYLSQVRSMMRNRRYDINPILDSNRISQSVFNRNLRQAGASPSQLFAGLQTGVTGRQRSDAAAYSQQNNVNNDYLAQQAHMDYQLGRDISGLKQFGYDANLKSRASKRNYLSTGLSQMQQYLQMRELMNNQKLADKERLSLLNDIIPDYMYERFKGFNFNLGK